MTAVHSYQTHFFLYIYDMNLAYQPLQYLLKTFTDYIICICILALLSPLILVLALLIKVTGKGPVIYSQKRMGKDGRVFNIYKFRSMHSGSEEGINLISDKYDRRITRLGRFMRKHKLDEIPNCVNVIKGEMSLVGPRPEQEYYIEKIISKEPRYKLLQTIKPGITSWGQVKFGYASNVEEMIKRLEYDLYYLENRSLVFDLKIMFRTIGIIFRGQGI